MARFVTCVLTAGVVALILTPGQGAATVHDQKHDDL